ncbi:MAG: acyl-CoA desaturase [Ramlibacter sp.]|nr:acyl-CoA desaturase [Ramlibacter sp.]
MHIAAVGGAVWYGPSWPAFWLLLGSWFLRALGASAGYHRYFAHRAFKTSRAFQFVLAILAMSSIQKGVLWWASNHRVHHQYSDTPWDPHSMVQGGFWWAHAGWLLAHADGPTEPHRVRDFDAFPELRWLDDHYLVPPVAIAVVIWLLAGWWGVVWGVLLPTVLVMHGTFTINSLAHWKGSRRYATTDNSTNNWLVVVLTLGDGFHNNHHHSPRTAHHGFMWWELDITYFVLRLLDLFRIVWDLRIATPETRTRDLIRDPSAPAP